MTCFYYPNLLGPGIFARKMQKYTLTDTGLTVSAFCLGTMYFGTKVDQQQSELLLNTFLDGGGNFIDTANNYAFWQDGGVGDESELALGRWLRSQRRDQIILASKCGARPTAFTGDLSTVKLEGLSASTIIKAVEDSLRRLQTDYLDILYGHIDFQDYPIDERLEAFARLRDSGKIRVVGTSNTWAWRVAESNDRSATKGWPEYRFIQQKWSYFRPKYNADFWVQRLIDDAMLDYVDQHPQITLLAYSTLLSGLYTRSHEVNWPTEYDTHDNHLRMEVLETIAQETTATNNQVVLAWMRQQRVPIIPIISGSKRDQIEESMGAARLRLSAEQMERLQRAGE